MRGGVLTASLVWAAFAPLVQRPGVESRTLPLPPTRALAIEITVGAVRVEGWDRHEAELAIAREGTSAPIAARLPIAVEETADRVTVRAIQQGGLAEATLRAIVTARVPRSAVIDRIAIQEGRLALQGLQGRVTAVLQRGPIDGSELAGAIRLETGIGDITVSRTRLSAGGVLRLRTFNGNVTLGLAERPADARILALALNGTIRSAIPLRMVDQWGPRAGEVTLGTGEPVIAIDVVTGTIEIKSP